ncbi:MAG: AEC family transporter [Thiothrix sp.]|nr:AEC family transporter [Thiothrix sp.]HPQ96559.1 AEC family transporter [Thiolinea sp.]
MDVLNLSLPLFGLVLLGWLAARWKDIPEQGLAWMQFFIIYVSLPALFFQLLRRTPVEQLAQFTFITATTGATLLVFTLAFCYGRYIQRNDIPTSTLQGVAGSYSNIGYMGPALTLAALGEAAVIPTALIFCFDNALLFTLTPLLVALGHQRRGGTQENLLQTLVRRVILHPFILATLAGVIAAWLQLELPVALEQILNSLKNAAAPCALFAMGVVVARQQASVRSQDVWVLLFIKMALHPLLVFGLLHLLGVTDPVWVRTAVLMAALPPALNIFVLAQQYGVYVHRASSIVLIGTLIAAVSVTALLYLMPL